MAVQAGLIGAVTVAGVGPGIVRSGGIWRMVICQIYL